MGAAMSMMSTAQSIGGMAMQGGMADTADASTQKATQTVQDAVTRAGKQVAEELKTSKPPSASVTRR